MTTVLVANDVQELLRLVGEVREFGDDPTTWRRHALEGLLRLCGARAGAFVEHWLPRRSVAPRLAFSGGLAARRHANGTTAVCAVEPGPEGVRRHGPVAPGVASALDLACPSLFAGFFRPLVTARRALADNLARRPSSHYEITTAEAPGGEYLSSYQPVPALGVIDSVHLYRGPGEPPFGDNQVTVLKLFHDELGRAWRTAPAANVAALPPRQAAVMRLLLQGKREKEIADELAIAQGTVHQHVAALYRRLGVSNRGELAAYAARAARRSGPSFARAAGL
ncbi:MAG TPA: helix-turn-helix transcriptional regulator [Polyangiaceae bacterium]|nr:helix-turn-helix transcriptional regulator [Polyangiaceae bacterium]